VALRDAWRERVLICTTDGGVSEADAESIALAELRGCGLPCVGIGTGNTDADPDKAVNEQ
jgi:hypothetical protein